MDAAVVAIADVDVEDLVVATVAATTPASNQAVTTPNPSVKSAANQIMKQQSVGTAMMRPIKAKEAPRRQDQLPPGTG